MAHRLPIQKLVASSLLMRPLLRHPEAMQIPFNTVKSFPIRPATNFTEKVSMFSPAKIKKYYELVPLFVIVGGGIIALCGFIFRNTLTRDDVRFSTKSQFKFEKNDLVTSDNPEIRKFRVYNQKYSVPEGLVDALKALEEPTEEELEAEKKKKKK